MREPRRSGEVDLAKGDAALEEAEERRWAIVCIGEGFEENEAKGSSLLKPAGMEAMV
jgi:hypothetical protein